MISTHLKNISQNGSFPQIRGENEEHICVATNAAMCLMVNPWTIGANKRRQVFPHLSHEKNPALLSIESWLVNRDPYFMVYFNPYITG